MQTNDKLISVVVPFYKGNRYINELLQNLDCLRQTMLDSCGVQVEVVVVNDSPDVPVAYTAPPQLPVTIVENPQNMGIHGSRIHGIQHARGSWIQLLDQDDLLIPENYPDFFRSAENGDVVVGNCFYFFGDEKQLLYANSAVMDYLIKPRRFLKIRNLIASPGHCLIRKSAFPAYWLENPMRINGSDDYFLWVLMFHGGARFHLNDAPVYVHRNSAEGNLSFDLAKMHRSNEEMCALLKANTHYPAKQLHTLHRSIVFKYLYDTHSLRLLDWLRFGDKVIDNAVYKITTRLLQIFR